MNRATPFPLTLLSHLLPAGALLLATGCAAPILDWSPDDAPKTIQVETSHLSYTVAFAPGAASLGPAETAKLARFVAQGGVQSTDRLVLETAASDGLAEKRRNSVTLALRRQGVGMAVTPAAHPGVGRDRLVLAVERAVATLPDCPNWSKPPIDYSAQVSSNFGCATVTNLGLMVADPADLVASRGTQPGDGATVVGAVQSYQKTQGRGSPEAPSPFAHDFAQSLTSGQAGSQ